MWRSWLEAHPREEQQWGRGIPWCCGLQWRMTVPASLPLLPTLTHSRPCSRPLQATHGTDYRRQPLGVNLAVVTVLVIAKLSSMHRVRILGINKD